MPDRATTWAWCLVGVQLFLFTLLTVKSVLYLVSEEKPNEARPVPTKEPVEICYCPCKWAYFESTQSYYKVGHNLTFAAACDYCKNRNATLTSIHSDAENMFINKLSTSGLSNPTQLTNLTLIGLWGDDVTNQVFANVDGSAYDYQAWASSAPFGQGQCVVTYSEIANGTYEHANLEHHWIDIGCNSTFRAFVCKQKATCQHVSS